MFVIKDISYNLKDLEMLFQLNVSIITYGKQIKFNGTYIWDLLPTNIKNSTTINNFQLILKAWEGRKMSMYNV